MRTAMDSGRQLPEPDLVERLLHHAVERLAGEPGEVDSHPGLLEGLLDMRAERDGAGSALAHKDAAALPGHDQSFVPQQPDGLLDGHTGYAVAAGQLVA